MNFENVLNLMRVERKSGRLLRGRKLTKYREHGFLAYWPYWLALAIGLAVGVGAGMIYNVALKADPSLSTVFQQYTPLLFSSLPTLVLIYSLVFTMMQQIQRSGVRASSQVPYWLPVTWQEHTLASILANLLGFTLASIIGIASAIILFSIFTGPVVLAVLTSLALVGAAFMASGTTEVLRVLQVRFIGAVYKSSGRAAIWVRFVGSILFFLVFYIIYFYVTSGGGPTFVTTVASGQSQAWFVPFVWLGMALSNFAGGSILQGVAFLAFSILFIVAIFLLATELNRRFGLYEPPAITVSRGIYAPKTGFLGRLGFSTVEAALIRKDFRAFTRRRELITIFIVPIVIIVVPLMQSLSQSSQGIPSAESFYLTAVTFLMPGTILAMSLGNFMIGEEGMAVWRIYSSPISPKSIVKSKYSFIVMFALLVLLITGAVGTLIVHPSTRTSYCSVGRGGLHGVCSGGNLAVEWHKRS